MGCLSDREKGPKKESQKWDFITLSDFTCTSAWTVVAFVWLWFLAFVGVAVYVVDTFTAVNLLAFDKWSSKVQPALDFKYSKWIFSVCICLSWALCIYEWLRAIRVIRRGGVAQSFLDPLAVSIQSMRPQGFKRFLVFTELTKSRKGADYVALFVYFSFKTAIRVILAEGPRQGVNAMTLYAVLQASIIPGHDQTDHNSFDQFWLNIGALADENHMQAIIYFSMLFTLVIWVFSALSLIISAILYIVFLWHYIPTQDGSLGRYCKRKVDKRLEQIVAHKVQAAIEEEERQMRKAEEKAERKAQKAGEMPPAPQIGIKKQPTLPNLGTLDTEKEDEQPGFGLSRQNTDASVSTLPLYTREPQRLQRQPTLPDLQEDPRPGMTRTNTAASGWSAAPSYATNAPLLDHAAIPGDSAPLPQIPAAIARQGSYSSFQQPWHERSGSQSSFGDGSVRSFTSGPRMQTPMSRPYTAGMGPRQGPDYRGPLPPRGPTPMRSNTPMSYEQGPQSATSLHSQNSFSRPMATPIRPRNGGGFHAGPVVNEEYYSTLHSQQSGGSFSRPMARAQGPLGSQTSFSRPYTPASSAPDVSKPLPQPNSYEMISQPTHTIPVAAPAPAPTPAPQSAGGYVAFNPSAYSATPQSEAPTMQGGPRRNITVAGGPDTGGDYFGDVKPVPQRSTTAPLEVPQQDTSRISVSDVISDYSAATPGEESVSRPTPASNPVQQRSATAGPATGPRPAYEPQSNQWRRYS